MKLKHSILSGLILFAGILGCTNDQNISGLTLDKDQLQLKIDETYQLFVTVEPASMSATELSWTSSDTEVVTVDGEGVVTAVAEGIAEITVSYGSINDVCTVTVGADFSMKLAVLDLSSSSITIEAIPSDESTTYYVSMLLESEYDALGSSDAVVEKAKKDIEAAASDAGMNVSDYLSENLKSGIQEFPFTDLKAETNYVAFGFSLDTDMNYGAFSECDASTVALEILDFTIEASNIKYDGFDVTITPSADDVKYYQACITKETYDYYGTDEVLMERYKEVFIANASISQMTIEDYMNSILVTGTETYSVVKLIPESDYYYIAIQFDESANHFNKMTKEAVRTIKPEYIDFTAEITMGEVTQNKAVFSLTASDQEQRYCMEVMSAEAVARFGETIAEGAYNWWYNRTATARSMDSPQNPFDQFVLEITYVGDQASVTRNDIESNQDYIVFVFAIDKNGIPISDVSYAEFHTEDRAFELEMDFDVSYSYVNEYLTASIIPSNSSQQYFFELTLAENVQSIIDQPELVVNWAMNYFFFNSRLSTGNSTRSTIMRSDDVYAIGFAYDSATGAVSEPYIKRISQSDFE